MSIKDLFKNRESFKLSSLKSADKTAREIGESSEFIEQHNADRERFIPPIDYSDPANFAKYGLAEEYYDNAIKRIYQTYPYDGSLREKTAWHNSSSYVDKYIFDNEYPRTNGYVIFSADGWGTRQGSLVKGYGVPAAADYEYIDIKGGPHTGSSMEVLKAGFSGSNVYDVDSNRQSNLEFNLSRGVTVEFWLKKDSFEISDNTQKEVVFDLWNGEASTGAGYGRLRIELDGGASGSPFRVTVMSGTKGFHQQPIGTNLTTTSLKDWKHYAFTFLSGASDISASLYVDGTLNHTANPTGTGSINEVTGALNAYLGALKAAVSGASGTAAGWGKLSASLDEFRYWKAERTPENIGRHWFTQVHGGTNTDDDKYNDRNPVDLGVYYKFNEGITLVDSTDSVVLDYSGRFSNGSWTGYSSNSRNVGSAILSASAAKTEFKDPIIYSYHPDVEKYSGQKQSSGSAHDVQNNAALYNMLPRWVIDEDVENGSNIKNLVQILSSYFDTLQLQIEALPTLREATYSTYGSASISSSAKPLPFANRLLEGLGLTTPELFIDAEIIEKLSSRDEKRNYEQDLHDVKNLIYHNIYNNLAYIYKSKGTEKSFRNLARCFGIDDELVKFNIYGQNALYQFKDNFRTTVVGKTLVDFSHPDRNTANVYQYPINSALGYITSSNVLRDMPCTIEAEVVFPKKKNPDEIGYHSVSFFTSSLFGVHSASVATATDLTWAPDDAANFQVYAIRTSSLDSDYDAKDAYFKLTSSSPFPFPALTSSVFDDVYDDTKWNFAVRLRHDKYKQNNMVAGTSGSNRGYTVEFYGVNTILDEVIHEFSASTSVNTALAESFISGSKRLYMGAHRTNFTGSVLQSTDIKASSLRFWYEYVDNDTIKAHAKDPTNFGLKNPYRNLSLFHTGANKVYTPAIETLALNWDFETLTGSDASGRFEIFDYSSGSTSLTERYDEIGSITKRKNPGRGDFFAANSTSSIEKTHFHIAKQQLPETIFSNDMINIVDEDDATFTRESRPTQYFFSIEKSMYQTISEEMIDYFATIVDFNNLIGEPVNRYRPNYKELTKLRQLFFERIDNIPDLDKYVDFYKWIDNSITVILNQMMPASANISEGLRTMVESHIFERNKHHNKYPTLRSRATDFESLTRTPGNERPFSKTTKILPSFKYSSFGYKAPPISELQSENSYWWLTNAERNHPSITSGDSDVDRARERILSASSPERDSFEDRGKTFAARFEGDFPIHGGVNFRKNKNIRYAHLATTEFGPTTVFEVGPYDITASNNFILFKESNIDDFPDSTDQVIPVELDKKKWNFIAANNSDGAGSDEYDYNVLKGDLVIPFNLYKHDVQLSGGYHDNINLNFTAGVDFTNLHVDTYGPDNEVPMQGPFTEKYVGGMQHRHVDINRFDSGKGTPSDLDEVSNRPEDWFIVMGTTLGNSDRAVGIIGPTYTTTGDYDKDVPRGRYYRGLTAKSPVNIRNIRTTGSTVGNYSSSIEYVSSVGRTQNNAFFKENEGVSLPSRHAVTLPKTTNVHSLIGVAGSTEEGNIFGPSSIDLNSTSNRVASDTEFTLPRRDLTGSDSIIVSRFSAPGGPEVSSRGYLDIIAEEHSPYNVLSFRNLSVRGSGSGEANTIRSNILPGAGREGLRSLLTRHQGKFGIDNRYSSIKEENYDTVGAYHKIPRNILRRIEYAADQTGPGSSVITASVYNNGWYSAPIPRSDLQYSWFTASFLSYPAKAEVYGHAPTDGEVSSSVLGVVPAYNFVSASQLVNNKGVATPFAAHNTIVVDGVISSENLLSASAFPHDLACGGVSSATDGTHALTLLRNGPYQHPSWKQIRTGENQVARYQRRNNILSVTTEPNKIFTNNEGDAIIPEQLGGQLRQFKEAPVTSKYKPIVHVLESDNLLDSRDPNSIDPRNPKVNTGLRYSYANIKDMFSDDNLNSLLDLKNTSRGAYDTVTDLYINSSDDTTAGEFKFLSYRETIYPQAQNTYLSGTRSRITFDLGFGESAFGIPAFGDYMGRVWRSNRSDRVETEDDNELDFEVERMSAFVLDAREEWDTATEPPKTPGTASGGGQLQNLYTIFHHGQNLGNAAVSTKSVKFGSQAYLTASSVHSNGPLNMTYLSQSVISLWFKSEHPSHNLSSSLVSMGRSDTAGNDEAMTFDIRLEGGDLYFNVGWPRGRRAPAGVSHIPSNGEGNLIGQNLSDNNWHHIVLAWYYKSASDRKYLAWVDGIPATSTASGTTNTGSAPASGIGSFVVIGGNPPHNSGAGANQVATDGFRGHIDEVTFLTGSLSGSGLGGFNNDIVTTIFNEGQPIDIVNSTDLGNLKIVSHYSMGDNTNDGPLAKYTGFIVDNSKTGLTVMSGNLSASVSDNAVLGFSATNQGIVLDSPFTASGGNTNPVSGLYSRQVPEREEDGTEPGYFVGDTLWEAGNQSGKEPAYDSYDKFRETIRGLGKDYSIIPEFRITNHMKRYLETHEGNFLAENKDWLTMVGGAPNLTSSANSDFFKTYSNSDFMKYFDVVKQDHTEAGYNPTNFTLKCDAIIKFFSYDGFYPCDRSIQLMRLAVESYVDKLNFKAKGATQDAFGHQVSIRTFLAPFFSPGVLYNSIKSGIAVDHPIMTSSFSSHVATFDINNEWTSSHSISSSFGARLPFELLVSPENHLAGHNIVDYEVHPSASINSTSSWDGSGKPLYKLAMNNFLAEVPRFFLKDQGVTTVVSAKDDNKKYFKAIAGNEYRMRVVLRNGRISRRAQLESNTPRDNSGGQDISITGSHFTQPSITMYSRRSAFGPPVHADYIKYNESYEPFTPPYMDGYADVEMVFRPTETKFFTIDEIVSNISSSYFRVGEQYFGNGEQPSSVAAKNQMHISSSFNLLDIARTKKAVYDPITGEPTSIEDDANAPSVAIIQPKWETPILDFANVNVTMPKFGSGSVSKGMWHQYGAEPGLGNGIFVEVQDLNDEELNNKELTGSLADLMGFTKDPIKLGQVLEEKTVREAVVAIPYVERGTKKRFFNISERQVKDALKAIQLDKDFEGTAGQSIVSMVKKMRHYVFPPKFDFLTNEGVTPVVMYIFEFEHTFSRRDLLDIWQNLSPELGREFETQSSMVSHELTKNELMGGELEDSLRWMVFKVKQKASDNYYDMLANSAREEGFTFELQKGIAKDKNQFRYSYNWPYDFFSLVELVKVDAEVIIETPVSPLSSTATTTDPTQPSVEGVPVDDTHKHNVKGTT